MDYQPGRLNDDVTLGALDLLAGIEATKASAFGGFHALVVDRGRGWREVLRRHAPLGGLSGSCGGSRSWLLAGPVVRGRRAVPAAGRVRPVAVRAPSYRLNIGSRAERYHPKASGSASVLGSRRESQFDDLARIVSGLNRGPTVAPSNSGSGSTRSGGLVRDDRSHKRSRGVFRGAGLAAGQTSALDPEGAGRALRAPELAPDQDRPWLGRPSPPRSPSRRPSLNLPLGVNSDQGLGGSASPSSFWHAGQRGAGVSRWLRA